MCANTLGNKALSDSDSESNITAWGYFLIKNAKLFKSQEVNWWTGVMWILLVYYCYALISCSDSHSDGTHSLQRIHWWTSDAMLNFIQIYPYEETNSNTPWLAWEWVHFFLSDFYFEVNYSIPLRLSVQWPSLSCIKLKSAVFLSRTPANKVFKTKSSWVPWSALG